MSGKKVAELNLERGFPTVEEALRGFESKLLTYKGQGSKAVIVIHGYGSSGVGGKIASSVRDRIKGPSMTGLVRQACPGEHWQERKREFLAVCPSLSDYDYRISGNRGVTVILLKS